ncbi:MAG: MoxR family ATPase [Neomegalonema sp.]|nr:MoxR family ATPase [Neomegalonema sp.]
MSDNPTETVDAAARSLYEAKREISRRVIGQEKVVEQSIIAILCGGHGLLVGAPGLAKTRLVETLGVVLGLSAKRVQFTPDLMPPDILGAEVLEEAPGGGRAFRFIQGPIFCQLLMADEINRAGPRTQAALLQAMQEKHVTIAGQRRDLPAPFHVLATQNPIEQEGTYPLPEAQLDRFLLQIDVDYPDRDAEREVLLATTGVDDAEAKQVLDAGRLVELQHIVRRLPVGDVVLEAILNLVRSCRPGEAEAHPKAAETLSWGPGPRAAQALALAVRARALIEGRYAPTLGDLAELAPAALRHRAALSFAARAEGVQLDDVLAEAIDAAIRTAAGEQAA